MSDPKRGRVGAEQSRVEAEKGRVEAEQGRAFAEGEATRNLTIDGAAKTVEGTAHQVYNAVRFVGFLCIITLVFLVALQVQILQLDDKLDLSTDNSERNAVTIEDLEKETRSMEGFINELQEVTPEEMSSNEAVQRAVQTVPVILQVLCEVNPEAPSCQGG
jgi:hypothetical protein